MRQKLITFIHYVKKNIQIIEDAAGSLGVKYQKGNLNQSIPAL